MVKEVSCKAAGYDCEFLVRDENETELVDLVQRHAKNTHEMKLSPGDVQGLIRSV